MKTLYIECNMGAAGDMLMAALLELLPEKKTFLDKINNMGLSTVRVSAEPSVKCGITGTHVSVIIVNNNIEETSVDVDMTAHEHGDHLDEHDHHHEDHHNDHEHSHDRVHDHHHHSNESHTNNHNHGNEGRAHNHIHSHAGLADIETLLSGLPVSANVKKNALGVYRLIAEAESRAHGRPVAEIHFHEVGNLDAIADITGVCLLMEELAPEKVIVSPVHVGSGFVRCAHGILPVPAPATAHILAGVPSYGGSVKGELCTPTGAAILKYFADSFGPMPLMQIEKAGYGMGKKDFEAANCVRVFLGENGVHEGGPNGQVAELSCNIDDMSGEAIGAACQALMEAGARDVFTIAVGMKKDRPGTVLKCLCDTEQADTFAALMLRHTSTFGVRKSVLERYTLEREMQSVETPFGKVRVKVGKGYGITKAKSEYEDIASLAKAHNLSVYEMERRILAYVSGEN